MVGTAEYLVEVWEACPTAMNQLRAKHGDCFYEHGTLRASCVAVDLARIFDALPAWSVSTDNVLCDAWQDWLLNGCPPNGFDDYPLLPWNHKVWKVEHPEHTKAGQHPSRVRGHRSA